MTTRRDFLRRTSLAIAGGLIVGDQALALFERLSHRKVWALGGMPLDLTLTTNFNAGMFSTYVNLKGRYARITRAVVDGGVAQVQDCGNGLYRVFRFLGDGPLVAKSPILLHNAQGIKPVGTQLEEGRFASSFIATTDKPATRKADQVVFDLHDGSTAGVVDGKLRGYDYARSTPPRFTEVPQIGKCLLIEGERTNYALHSRPLSSEGT